MAPSRSIARLLALAIALTAVVIGVAAPGAHAKSGEEVMFEAPGDLRDPARRDGAFAQLDTLGVSAMRIVLYWRDVAPAASDRVRPDVDLTDPASYDWSIYEPIVAGAAARGWKIQLTVSGPVPRWATRGARDQLTRPSTTQFRRFMTAVSGQFGSRVTRWSIWNEPNHPDFLLPQYDSRRRAASPSIYRGLYVAGLAGLADAGDTHPVLFGETAPNGRAPRKVTKSTPGTVPPLDFLRGALCLDSRYHRKPSCKRLTMSGFAHHAYTTKRGPLWSPPTTRLVTIGVLSRLKSALDRAARAGAVRRSLPIYLTEFGIQSLPDPFYGVSQQRQNEYRAIAEKIAYDNRRVAAFSQYLLTDDRPTGKGSNCCGGFESGLLTAGGRAKLAFDGFRLPLVVERSGSRVEFWGLVRPASGRTKVTVERRTGNGKWRRVATANTDSRTAWTGRGRYERRAAWRVAWTDPAGTVLRSPPVRAYSWPKRLR